MRFIERLLFFPVVIVATGLALVAVFRHPGPVSYAAVAAVAGLWVMVFVRSLLFAVRALFWLTCLGALVGLYLLGPTLIELWHGH